MVFLKKWGESTSRNTTSWTALPNRLGLIGMAQHQHLKHSTNKARAGTAEDNILRTAGAVPARSSAASPCSPSRGSPRALPGRDPRPPAPALSLPGIPPLPGAGASRGGAGCRRAERAGVCAGHLRSVPARCPPGAMWLPLSLLALAALLAPRRAAASQGEQPAAGNGRGEAGGWSGPGRPTERPMDSTGHRRGGGTGSCRALSRSPP